MDKRCDLNRPKLDKNYSIDFLFSLDPLTFYNHSILDFAIEL